MPPRHQFLFLLSQTMGRQHQILPMELVRLLDTSTSFVNQLILTFITSRLRTPHKSSCSPGKAWNPYSHFARRKRLFITTTIPFCIQLILWTGRSSWICASNLVLCTELCCWFICSFSSSCFYTLWYQCRSNKSRTIHKQISTICAPWFWQESSLCWCCFRHSRESPLGRR